MKITTLLENGACGAELGSAHGLSLYIETPKHKILFDMGPDGGKAGGMIVAQGTPEQLAQDPASVTGPFLREILPQM